MKERKNWSRSAGLTLIELLVTLTLMSILITWASSDVNGVRQKEKMQSAAQSLMSTIHYSQDYARHLSLPSVLCAGTPADKCTQSNWNKGWTLFSATQKNATQTLKAVRTFNPNVTGINIQLSGLKNTGKVIINSEGFILEATTQSIAVICDQNQSFHVTLEINKAQTTIINTEAATTISEKCQNATT